MAMVTVLSTIDGLPAVKVSEVEVTNGYLYNPGMSSIEHATISWSNKLESATAFISIRKHSGGTAFQVNCVPLTGTAVITAYGRL